MANYSHLDPLTNRQKDICSYASVFGALLGLTCLIQHITITRAHWLTYTLALAYVLIIVCFILLGLQYWFSPVSLIVAIALSMFAEFILIKNGVFSLVVLLQFIYSVIVVVVIYTEQIPKLLKQKALAIKAERDEWKDKI
jgi:hypothetical protein